jgi:hypothetical protein
MLPILSVIFSLRWWFRVKISWILVTSKIPVTNTSKMGMAHVKSSTLINEVWVFFLL